MQDSALLACQFTRDYSGVWDRYFPNCARRAHWQITQLVRSSEDGELFSIVAGRTAEVFGMDEETSLLRTEELIREGLIKSEEKKIHASTCLYPTADLIEKYDNHVRESVQLLYDTAKSLGQSMPRLGGLVPGSDLNGRFFAFFGAYQALMNQYRQRFLKTSIPKSRSLQIKAQRAMMTYAYWYIFTSAWIHRHPQATPKRPYLLVDDFHPTIFNHTGVSSTTTAGYIKDLIDWGCLQRLDRKAGVPRGKFAVRMPQEVFDYFREAYAASTKPVIEHALEFCRISTEPSATVETAAVIGFPTGQRENVSETSADSPSVASTKKV